MKSIVATSFPELTIPAQAGVGLKAAHFQDILDKQHCVSWFEVHPENYMGAGGAPHHNLGLVRQDYPLSLHGVGLSIGADRPLDKDHLARLKLLNERYEPDLFSEHLAWSTHDAGYLNDLLPVPYTEETLRVVVEHVDQFQNFLGRQILLENPSTYVLFEHSTMSEIDFMASIAKQSGCGLLLDINNVFVSATNHNYSAGDYLQAYPMSVVQELHLGGHAPDEDEAGRPLLIDAHDRNVDDEVWALYAQVIEQTGPIATLVEWDNDVPTFDVLQNEASLANTILDTNTKYGAIA
ncbi:MAG: hypothetical protein COB90_01485 [Hyphomicrobiales bacterium]|nr:MAG: hypothetical protein COB90_01485 [Hyphomicrobiales bacterium]